MHKRVLAYLLFVVFLLFNGMSVMAASYDVTAKVPAPLPAGVPTITTPGNNSVIIAPTVTVVGTCPIVVPALIVVLVRDSLTIGSGSCASDGSFRIVVGLVLGVNIIYSKFVTITGESSSYSLALSLVYQPTNPPTTTVVKNSEQTPQTTAKLAILFDYDFVTYTTTQNTKTIVGITGGKSPYTLIVDWGDGTSKNYNLSNQKVPDLNHRYKTVASEPMKIRLTLTDALGNKVQTERALVSFEKPHYETLAYRSPDSKYKYMFIWVLLSILALLIVTVRYKKLFLNDMYATKNKKSVVKKRSKK